MNTKVLLDSLGIAGPGAGLAIGTSTHPGGASPIDVYSPIDGSLIERVGTATSAEVEAGCQAAHDAFLLWRNVPGPRRGELVRQFGQLLREYKEELGALVTLEAGKIQSEAEGEVQEMIDVCDFATGLSRQLYGLTIQSERPQHRLMEQWHPLGAVGVISAFNFPVAVWSWNAALALVCGDPVVWKPSEKTPFCALACHSLLMRVIRDFEDAPDALSVVVNGGRVVGEALVDSPRLPLISATGSIAMGRAVGQRVAKRLGQSLLELGGNNALIVAPSADLDLAVKAITFAAVGTTGQRCTTLRRLIVHESIKAKLMSRLLSAWASIRIGDPRDTGVLIGPLIDKEAGIAMRAALELAVEQGGRVHGGGRVTAGVPANGVYVNPALVEISPDAPIVQTETFAPICYVHEYDRLEEAIEIQNGVPQGLASAIFTENVLEAEIFCGPYGSDCGIANVNIGTSGAEIGGAFGGEKETGGGRESGSDAWKNYMRRTTNTINYGKNLPLAQGVEFV
ncbi:MAG: aldehyde dehydrogenase family protein [Rhodothermaceae bacterium]|nr:aldehyde dehydrogenase family protein [Rhodothermaceae bacterium]MXX57547.1 aldehyde dehydrogenase family protein [Rhodothermaceae bacterium]MYD18237.1 aldehyde dehydrogenase family protein [Rhodothermaceae bacterium]MYD57751.1 aldehyde dehydrogenase family protein [Rhodothermaceae bacterium]MYI43387.1 aldehyde dehydrogenase family protein [Rhodothermaceae bacterium]